ncbi:hypothetical protein D3C72_2085610 [compost metagenome]
MLIHPFHIDLTQLIMEGVGNPVIHIPNPAEIEEGFLVYNSLMDVFPFHGRQAIGDQFFLSEIIVVLNLFGDCFLIQY